MVPKPSFQSDNFTKVVRPSHPPTPTPNLNDWNLVDPSWKHPIYFDWIAIWHKQSFLFEDKGKVATQLSLVKTKATTYQQEAFALLLTDTTGQWINLIAPIWMIQSVHPTTPEVESSSCFQRRDADANCDASLCLFLTLLPFLLLASWKYCSMFLSVKVYVRVLRERKTRGTVLITQVCKQCPTYPGGQTFTDCGRHGCSEKCYETTWLCQVPAISSRPNDCWAHIISFSFAVYASSL